MDDVIKTLDDALNGLGLSDAAASQLAVGNPSAIKNLRMQRGAEKRYNYVTLQKLAAALDLELYFGPKRNEFSRSPMSPPGFMDASTAFDPTKPLPEKSERTFLPIPYSSRTGGKRGVGPVAFSQAFFAETGLIPDDLRFVRLQDDTMMPTVAEDALIMIDEGAVKPAIGQVFAVLSNGKIGGGCVTQLTPDTVAFIALNPDRQPTIHKFGDTAHPFRILGRVVWQGHVI